MRQDLIPYASLPFYRAMLERSGFEADLAAFDEGMAGGDIEQAKAGLSEALLDSLAGIGDAEQVTGAVERYREAGATSPVRRRHPRHRLRRRARGRRRADLGDQRRDLGADAGHDRGVLVDAVGAGVEKAAATSSPSSGASMPGTDAATS